MKIAAPAIALLLGLCLLPPGTVGAAPDGTCRPADAPRGGGRAQQDYIQIELADALVTSIPPGLSLSHMHVAVSIDGDGLAQTRGAVQIKDGPSDTVLFTEKLGATANCADTDGNGVAGLTLLQFAMRDARGGDPVLVRVTPDSGEIDESGEEMVIIAIGDTSFVGKARTRIRAETSSEEDGVSSAAKAKDATPAGAVMFFNLATCPEGWAELVSARGRYLVGLPSGGTLAQGVGTPLTAGENRPVGQHDHAVSDPGHSHIVDYEALVGNNGGPLRYVTQEPIGTNSTFSTRSSATGIAVQTAGTVAGTNAPYLQLQVCEKQ